MSWVNWVSSICTHTHTHMSSRLTVCRLPLLLLSTLSTGYCHGQTNASLALRQEEFRTLDADAPVFRQNAFWRFALMWWPAHAGVIMVVVVRHKLTQAYISRTVWRRSPNFTGTFTPVGSISKPDLTSLSSSGRKLLTFEKRAKMTPPTAST